MQLCSEFLQTMNNLNLIMENRKDFGLWSSTLRVAIINLWESSEREREQADVLRQAEMDKNAKNITSCRRLPTRPGERESILQSRTAINTLVKPN